MIQATCGHALIENEGENGLGYQIAVKDRACDGSPMVDYMTVCTKCLKWWEKNGELLSPEEAEEYLSTKSDKKGLIYLATPYSHPNPEVMEQRFRAVNKVAAKLMEQGLHIFSPISHSHPISIEGNLPTNWEYWESYDRVFLNASQKLIVLKLDGWEESVGVAAEIRIAGELGIDIEYIEA